MCKNALDLHKAIYANVNNFVETRYGDETNKCIETFQSI